MFRARNSREQRILVLARRHEMLRVTRAQWISLAAVIVAAGLIALGTDWWDWTLPDTRRTAAFLLFLFAYFGLVGSHWRFQQDALSLIQRLMEHVDADEKERQPPSGSASA